MNKNYLAQLKAIAKKKSRAIDSKKLTVNELAESLKTASCGFLATGEWTALRDRVINHYGGKCMCCGRTPSDHRHINVDHIKPRKTHPELSLDFDNLQVLCGVCNKKKGNKHMTDYRNLAELQGKTV